MKESRYKSYDELPLLLNAETVAQVLGVAPSSVYELMHEKHFPTLRIGSRIVYRKRSSGSGWKTKLGWSMMQRSWPKRDPIKNYFPLSNEVFSFGLCSGEIAVYGYLVHCEDRKTYQCWPSYKTIGKAADISENTVRKYVGQLEKKSFISTEPTSVFTKDGMKRNGNLLYTILPIQGAINAYYRQQSKRWMRNNRNIVLRYSWKS